MDLKLSRRRLLATTAGTAATLAMPSIVRAASHKPLAGKELRLLTWSDNTGLAILD
jgi:putative spermidine/putrescine transport system substrate-binding protein